MEAGRGAACVEDCAGELEVWIRRMRNDDRTDLTATRRQRTRKLGAKTLSANEAGSQREVSLLAARARIRQLPIPQKPLQ